jgi:hypothetical protein
MKLFRKKAGEQEHQQQAQSEEESVSPKEGKISNFFRDLALIKAAIKTSDKINKES